MTHRRAARAAHMANVDVDGHPGPFILTACVGHDGSVWASLLDAAGETVAMTPLVPAPLPAPESEAV